MGFVNEKPLVPSDMDRQQARKAIESWPELNDSENRLQLQIAPIGKKGQSVELPEAASKLLRQLLTELADGNVVTVVSVSAELTTQQAADLLNVSRPYIVGLIDKGVLPARMVGTHRRLMLTDVLSLKTANTEAAYAALAEMTEIDQEHGLR